MEKHSKQFDVGTIKVTDSELKQAFRKGFANREHLSDLLKRTDLPEDRQKNVRPNLAQAYCTNDAKTLARDAKEGS